MHVKVLNDVYVGWGGVTGSWSRKEVTKSNQNI